MKVCFVTTAFPRWLGDGQAVFVWEAVRAVSRQGIQVCVVAMHSPSTSTREYMEGIKVVRPRYWWPEHAEILRKEGAAGLPVTWSRYPVARLQILPFALVHTVAAMRCARACDLIHAEWTLSAAASVLGSWAHRRPVLATVQGSDIFQVAQHPLGAWFTRATLLRCNQITALSHALKKETAAIGIPESRIKVIPNGVDTKRFVPPAHGAREKLVLYVGTFIERKGLAHLLAAMPDIFRAFPDHRLLLVGEGPEESSLRQLSERLGIADRVSFLDFQPQERVRDWMQRAQLFVLPSLEEGMGVVLLEALACGTPVVASQIDGIQDVVTPEVGILVPPADAQALSTAVQNILCDPGRWQEMSRCARERAVSQYDWERVACQFIELYQSILA